MAGAREAGNLALLKSPQSPENDIIVPMKLAFWRIYAKVTLIKNDEQDRK